MTRTSPWSPLWAVLGITVPACFAVQVDGLLHFLRPWELVPAYGTVWLFGAFTAVLATGSARAIDTLRHWSTALPARHDTAMVAARAVVLGTLTYAVWAWMRSVFRLETLGLGGNVAMLACAGATVAVALKHRDWAGFRRLLTLGRRLAAIGAIAAATAVAIALAQVGHRQPPHGAKNGVDRPNVVLITLDSLAAGHLSVYGYPRNTSPMIGAWAQHAIVFDRFHANSNFTTPAVASILTGRRPWDHRAVQLPGRPLGQADQSLPAVLRSAGYTTAYFSGNAWAGADRMGLGDAFDVSGPNQLLGHPPCYDAWARWLPYACSVALEPFTKYSTLALWAAFRAATAQSLSDSRLDIGNTVDPATAWLKSAPKDRVFLWVHLFPPHDPYLPPAPWLGTFDPSIDARTALAAKPEYHFLFKTESIERRALLEARYDEVVRSVDEAVGQLLEEIQRDLGPNTIVVLTADHGESFRHDYGGHGGPMLYEDITRIPLIVRLPYDELAGTRLNALAEQIDLAPTIAARVGLDSAQSWQGTNRIVESGSALDSPIYTMNFEQSPSDGRLRTGAVAILEGHWKLVQFLGDLRYPHMPNITNQLFDLGMDPNETLNLAGRRLPIERHLADLLGAEFARHNRPQP